MAQVPLFTRDPGSVTLRTVNQTTDQVLTNQIESGVVTRSLWCDAVGTTLNVATGAAMTAISIGTGMGAGDVITLGGTGSTTRVAGNLAVLGTTTTIQSEVVNMADNHLYMNADYTTVVAQTGGLVVNYLPTATNDTVAAGGFTAATTVATTGAAVFAAGDLIQVSGATIAANDGLYEVASHAANVLTIRGVGATVEDFTQNAFTVSAGAVGAIRKVNVSVMRSSTAGTWETGFGAVTPVAFTPVATGSTTLQQAYDASTSPATITTNATDDEVLITGTAGLRVTGTGADNTVSAGFGFEVDTTGGFRLLGDAASTISVDTTGLTLSTTTGGALNLTSAGAITAGAVGTVSINSTGGALDIGDGANAFAINVGTGGAARTITIGNSTGATSVVVNAGTGALDLGANAIAHAITIGNSTGATSAAINVGTGALDLGTNGIAHTVSIGSATGASVLTANLGTGGMNLGTNAVAGTITVGNSTGATSVVLNCGTGALNVGTNAIAHTITVGNATGASALNLTSGSGGTTFTALSGTSITLNQTGDLSLVGYTATSIVGALNEVKGVTYTGAAFVAGQIGYISSANTVSKAVGTSNNIAARVFGVTPIATDGGGNVRMQTTGAVSALFVTGLTLVDGDEVFMSLTAGSVTNDVTGFVTTGNVIQSLGYVKDASTYTDAGPGTLNAVIQLVYGQRLIV